MTVVGELSSKSILVVEDEYIIAIDIATYFSDRGARVVGPVGTIEEAIGAINGERLDAAVLDLNLHGEMAFDVADALIGRGIPFVFATGYDRDVIPGRFASVKRCEKPTTPEAIAMALFASSSPVSDR
ncbi:MAG: response regulator [Hyphomicrobiaceae bacterium]|nr:MAG: response regulator [Hyphomicrobiaceae bacterium]